jgi:hypothetical protein
VKSVSYVVFVHPRPIALHNEDPYRFDPTSIRDFMPPGSARRGTWIIDKGLSPETFHVAFASAFTVAGGDRRLACGECGCRDRTETGRVDRIASQVHGPVGARLAKTVDSEDVVAELWERAQRESSACSSRASRCSVASLSGRRSAIDATASMIHPRACGRCPNRPKGSPSRYCGERRAASRSAPDHCHPDAS